MSAKEFLDIVATPEVVFVVVLFCGVFHSLWRDL
jgi:hypothetical protein